MTWVKWMSTTNELELKQFLINLDIIVKNHVILIINVAHGTSDPKSSDSLSVSLLVSFISLLESKNT